MTDPGDLRTAMAQFLTHDECRQLEEEYLKGMSEISAAIEKERSDAKVHDQNIAEYKKWDAMRATARLMANEKRNAETSARLRREAEQRRKGPRYRSSALVAALQGGGEPQKLFDMSAYNLYASREDISKLGADDTWQLGDAKNAVGLTDMFKKERTERSGNDRVRDLERLVESLCALGIAALATELGKKYNVDLKKICIEYEITFLSSPLGDDSSRLFITLLQALTEGEDIDLTDFRAELGDARNKIDAEKITDHIRGIGRRSVKATSDEKVWNFACIVATKLVTKCDLVATADEIPDSLNPETFLYLSLARSSEGLEYVKQHKDMVQQHSPHYIVLGFARGLARLYPSLQGLPMLKEPSAIMRVYNDLYSWSLTPGASARFLLNSPGIYDEITRHITETRTLDAANIRLFHSIPGFLGKIPVRVYLTPLRTGGMGGVDGAFWGSPDPSSLVYSSREVDLTKGGAASLPNAISLASLAKSNDVEKLKLCALGLTGFMTRTMGMYCASTICETTILTSNYVRSLLRRPDVVGGDLPTGTNTPADAPTPTPPSTTGQLGLGNEDLSYIQSGAKSVVLAKDGVALSKEQATIELLRRHIQGVVHNFFVMKEGSTTDRRRLIARHFIMNARHFMTLDQQGDDMNLPSSRYVQDCLDKFKTKLDQVSPEMAMIGQSPYSGHDTYVDMFLLYAPDFQSYLDQKKQLYQRVTELMDTIKKEYSCDASKTTPFGTPTDVFNKSIKDANPFVELNESGYPTQTGSVKTDTVKELIDKYVENVTSMFETNLSGSNVSIVMTPMRGEGMGQTTYRAGGVYPQDDGGDPGRSDLSRDVPYRASRNVDAGRRSYVTATEGARISTAVTSSVEYAPCVPGDEKTLKLSKFASTFNENVHGDTSWTCKLFHVIDLTEELGQHQRQTGTDNAYQDFLYNTDPERPQMFAMLDAAAVLFNARQYYNPSDCIRGEQGDLEMGAVDDMHYWCRTLTESFLFARQQNHRQNTSLPYEFAVKRNPKDTFPSRLIGSLTDDSFKRMFPLLPLNCDVRDNLRKVRSLNVLWGELKGNRCTSNSVGHGAWMPLSQYHIIELYKAVGLFDEKYNVPSNPWCAHNGNGVSRVFNQSYHSVYHTDSYRAPHFRDWVENACRYQVPREGCYAPFSQYGGTPVQADFVHHRVEFADRGADSVTLSRHKQLVYNRFGMTFPLRLGQQFHDRGYLQDLYQPTYRPYADLSREQRGMDRAKEAWISNFMSYARTHSIIALASCNHGTEDPSVPRIVRNLYRLYVDSYECMGANPDDDSVPCIMGFLPTPVDGRDDRPVTLYAGSLTCLNTKLEKFCHSDANRGERVCQLYKQVYLNDAAILYNRLSRNRRRELLHTLNYSRAAALGKRGPDFTRAQFDNELISLQDAYIEFLQQTCIGLLLESGANLGNVPLQLLEPRELEVSLYAEDTDMVGNDYLTPRTAEIIKDLDFTKDNLSRTQLAILSLIPPNHRILSTLKFSQNTEIIDLEHAKKRIQQETIASNKKVWQRYTDALISGAFAAKLLEIDGPIDYGFDMSAIKDPLKESENIMTRMSTSHSQASSSVSQSVRSEAMRRERGPESVLGMNTGEFEQALTAVRNRVERDYRRQRGHVSRVQVLAQLRVPDHIKRMLTREYQ